MGAEVVAAESQAVVGSVDWVLVAQAAAGERSHLVHLAAAARVQALWASVDLGRLPE